MSDDKQAKQDQEAKPAPVEAVAAEGAAPA